MGKRVGNIDLRPWIWAPAPLEITTTAKKHRGKDHKHLGLNKATLQGKSFHPLSASPLPPTLLPSKGSPFLLGTAGSRTGSRRQISTPSSPCFSKNWKCVSPLSRHVSIQISISHSARYLPSCIYFPITKLSSAF